MKVVAAQAIKTPRFKRLRNTLKTIAYLKRGKTLVLKSSRINQYQIKRLNSEIARFFHTELQVKSVSGVIRINDLMDELLSDFTTHVNVDSGSCSQELDYPSKVLCIKGYTDYPSKLHNLSLIPNLRNIRFDHVSVPSIQPIFALNNLTSLSFVMCEIGDAFMTYSTTTHSPNYTLPNLTHLEIDMCYDLKQLPSAVCNLVNLNKLSITNCQELEVLPKGIGALSNIEFLSLRCCTRLQELPESIGSLRKLRSVDISDCLSISVLPEEIGELCGLRVLEMKGCGGLQELPMSVSELSQLEEVICDEETAYLWMDFESDLPNLKINVVQDDRLESFMKIVQ